MEVVNQEVQKGLRQHGDQRAASILANARILSRCPDGESVRRDSDGVCAKRTGTNHEYGWLIGDNPTERDTFTVAAWLAGIDPGVLNGEDPYRRVLLTGESDLRWTSAFPVELVRKIEAEFGAQAVVIQENAHRVPAKLILADLTDSPYPGEEIAHCASSESQGSQRFGDVDVIAMIRLDGSAQGERIALRVGSGTLREARALVFPESMPGHLIAYWGTLPSAFYAAIRGWSGSGLTAIDSYSAANRASWLGELIEYLSGVHVEGARGAETRSVIARLNAGIREIEQMRATVLAKGCSRGLSVNTLATISGLSEDEVSKVLQAGKPQDRQPGEGE